MIYQNKYRVLTLTLLEYLQCVNIQYLLLFND